MAVFVTALCTITVLVATSRLALAGSFSQRHDGFSSSYEWNPSIPRSDRVLRTRNARADDAQNWHFKDSQPVPETSRRSLNVKPEPSTIRAMITWPRVSRTKPGLPPPQPEPSEPDDDLDETIADPDTDPPVLAARNEETGEPVVRTTLLTPLSHGYVVAFVKKPLLPKLNDNPPSGRLIHLTPRLPFQFKTGDGPAFLMYIPPESSKGQPDTDRTLSGDRRLRAREPRPVFNRQRGVGTDDAHGSEFDYEEAFRDAEAAAERTGRRLRQRQRNLRARDPPLFRGRNVPDLLRPEVVGTYVQDGPFPLEPDPYQVLPHQMSPDVLMVAPHQHDPLVPPSVFTTGADDQLLFQLQKPKNSAARGPLKTPLFSFL